MCALHTTHDLLDGLIVQIAAQAQLDDEDVVAVDDHRTRRGDHLKPCERREEDLLLSRELRERRDVRTSVDHAHANLE